MGASRTVSNKVLEESTGSKMTLEMFRNRSAKDGDAETENLEPETPEQSN